MAVIEGASAGGRATDNIGYNKKKVEDLAFDIQETYKNVTVRLRDQVQKSLIESMGMYWYAPEAIEFFFGIRDDFREMGRSMLEAYQAFRNWVQEAGENWAQNTAGTWTTGDIPHLAEITERTIEVNISCIHYCDDNGNIVLDELNAKKVADSMPQLKKEMMNIVKIEHGKLEAKAAFIGRGQGAAATRCFTKVSDAISTFFNYVEKLSEVINEYAKKYSDVGESIASNFEAAEVNVSEE